MKHCLFQPFVSPTCTDVGTGGATGARVPTFSQIFVYKVSFFGLHSAFFAGKGAHGCMCSQFLNAFRGALGILNLLQAFRISYFFLAFVLCLGH